MLSNEFLNEAVNEFSVGTFVNRFAGTRVDDED